MRFGSEFNALATEEIDGYCAIDYDLSASVVSLKRRTRQGPVHTVTTPEKFENAALFLRLGLLSTLIRHENAALN